MKTKNQPGWVGGKCVGFYYSVKNITDALLCPAGKAINVLFLPIIGVVH
jgi:hypothetical protein